MDVRFIMTMIAITLPLASCNETIMPAAEKAAATPAAAAPSAVETTLANERATIAGLSLSSSRFAANPRKFDEARTLVRRAWGQDCRPGSVSEVIAGGTESTSWRVDCVGGEISTSTGGVSPDYIIEIPNEPDQSVIVNQCARRDGALRCDTTGRDRS